MSKQTRVRANGAVVDKVASDTRQARHDRTAVEEHAADLIHDLEPGLRIDEHALDTALVQQPDLFYRVSRELAMAVSRRDFSKQARDELMAELDADLRATAARHEEKITEGSIKAQLTMDPTVKRAEAEYLTHQRIVGQLTALKDAFIQRSYVLKDLASLYVANYYTDASAGSRTTEQVKNRAGEDARRAMSDARKAGRG